MNALKGIGSVIIIIVVGLVAWNVTTNFIANRNNSETSGGVKGLVLSKSNYVKECRIGAEAESTSYTTAQIDAYCGCTYDKGVTMYGAEKWTSELMDMVENNNTFTAEANTIINECMSEVL
jgi:hypothetical protein